MEGEGGKVVGERQTPFSINGEVWRAMPQYLKLSYLPG